MQWKEVKQLFEAHAAALKNNKTDPTAKYRASSYARVADAIANNVALNSKVTQKAINALPVTDYMRDRITYLKQGNQFAPMEEKMTSKVSSKVLSDGQRTDLLNKLVDFMGLGPAKAKELIDKGLRSVNELHMQRWLNDLPKETQLFIQMKPIREIPHGDIKRLEPLLLSCSSPAYKLQIVGSYRRKKPISRDIDLMVVSRDAAALQYVTQVLSKKFKGHIYPYSQGTDKLSMIIDMQKLLSKPGAVYKIDIFRVEPEDETAMLLYSTGSKEHNILMRQRAKAKGALLNQKGMFIKKNNELIRIPLKTEKDYFDFLSMEYKEPEQRA
jgi:DNA polymerase/3'-5' exonuclease PolX